MDYEEISILESASRCGLLDGVRTDRIEVRRNCVFCSDRRMRLYLNTDKNQFHCHNCGAGGNSVTLYAMYMGVDNTTAYKELTNTAVMRIFPNTKRAEIEECIEPSTLLERHQVYSELLNRCNLSSYHQVNLINRGLTLDAIKQMQYKTIPTGNNSNQIANELSKRHNLKGIPGFYTEYGQWRMMQRKGFFVPMCTKDGYIQGLQIRIDNQSKNKFKWFSSRYNENGTRAYQWVHVTGWCGQEEAIITEGGLKASVAWFLTEGQCFIGIPGVNCVDKVVVTLREMGITNVYIAFDMDCLVNKDVEKAIKKLMSLLRNAGITYRQYKWEPEFKGIDDLLWHRHLQRKSA